MTTGTNTSETETVPFPASSSGLRAETAGFGAQLVHRWERIDLDQIPVLLARLRPGTPWEGDGLGQACPGC